MLLKVCKNYCLLFTVVSFFTQSYSLSYILHTEGGGGIRYLLKFIQKFLKLILTSYPVSTNFFPDHLNSLNLLIYGTVNVISRESCCKEGQVQFTTIPLKPFSNQYCGRYCRFSGFSNLFLIIYYKYVFLPHLSLLYRTHN